MALALLILPKNGRVKTLWTSIAAVVAPACFVSADAIEIYELSSAAKPEDRFQNKELVKGVNEAGDGLPWRRIGTV